MADREKVMQWLKTCATGCEDGCPYEYKNLVYRVECKADLMSDAIALLREHEPVRPYQDYDGLDVWRCGNCNTSLFHITETEADDDMKNYIKFCKHCGKAVRWE